ncbi:hypothetical protein [Gordonia paraffinivorans]|uniref:hypothetical protein n=1 Tax=Gordonia paraffinivorans TaxID=175628 RepID=UPI00311A275A
MILLGALVGALLLKIALWPVFAVAAALSAGVMVCGYVLAAHAGAEPATSV